MKILAVGGWCMLALLAPAVAASEDLAFRFIDPIGDSSSDIDVGQMSVIFDNATGAYQIHLYTTADNPFVDMFRLNINLFNPDTGSTACDQSFLMDTVNDFDEAVPKRRVSLDGMAPTLLHWQVGHRVATNFVPFGTPDCNLGFNSVVVDLPFAKPYPQDDIAAGNVFVEIRVAPIFEDGFDVGDTDLWSSTVP